MRLASLMLVAIFSIALGVTTACTAATPAHAEFNRQPVITATPPTPIANPGSRVGRTAPTSQPTNPNPPADYGPDNFPSDINPLTGIQVDEVTLLRQRPVIVKISNAPALVRPQAGIGQADLVFEHYAEGGLTRFSAVFYSILPVRVGSVRSARLIDHELMPMYRGLLAFSGASIGVEEIIFNADYADRAFKGVLYGPPYYWRDEAIPVPHNMFVNIEALSELASAQGVNTGEPLLGMTFAALPPPNPNANASNIDIRYVATRAQWAYDAERGVYLRTSDGQPHYDANTEQQVTAANVVVLFAEHEESRIVESEFQGNVTYGWQIYLWPAGSGLLFRDGQVYEIFWARSERDHLITLHTADNSARMDLKPGNTFFQIVKLPQQQDPAEEWVRWE